MARQTNGAYWAQRMKNMEDALKDQAYSYVENMEAQFAAAQAEIEKQLAAWYQRLADNNEISLAEAKRLLGTSWRSSTGPSRSISNMASRTPLTGRG